MGLCLIYYGAWITGFGHKFYIQGNSIDLTFNSMLAHLIQGQFDVDPNIIGEEGFFRNGKTYAYWGVFCALIRLPMILIPQWAMIDVTALSCLIAVCVALFFKLKTIDILKERIQSPFFTTYLYWPLIIAFCLSGAQVQFLKPSAYQEVCLWAGALAAGFVHYAVIGIASKEFTARSLKMMALFAGLTLLCRVSMAIGLYVATAGLILMTLFRGSDHPLPHAQQQLLPSQPVVTPLAQAFSPALILAFFLVTTGLINFSRWGNPLVFADFYSHLMTIKFSDRLPRMEEFGLFNLARIPLGLIYYFFPLWFIRNGQDELFLERQHTTLLDAMELPPGSFFLTDTLLVLVIFMFVWMLLKSKFNGESILRNLQPNAIPIYIGLSIPCLLMLSAIYMSHRYRIEFYPLFEFAVFHGLLFLSGRPTSKPWINVLGIFAMRLSLLGVVMSHLTLALYRVSPWGPSLPLLHQGVLDYYRGFFLSAM